MAKGRFLSRALSTSDRISSISDRAFRIWTMCLPFTDRDGRVVGSSRKLLRQCFPDLLLSYRWTMPDVDEAIGELVRVGLWSHLVDDHGEPFYQFFQFEKHQKGMRYDRELESGFTYTGVHPDFAPKNPAQVQVEVKDQVEVKCESSAHPRARVKAEDVPERTHTPRISGGREHTARLLEPTIVAEFQSVHPLGKRYIPRLEYPADYDRKAIERSAHVLQDMPDRLGFWRRCLAFLPPERQTIEACIGCLNNPALVNGTNGSGPSRTHLADIDRAMEQTRQIDAAKKRLIEQGNPRPTFEEIDAEYLRATT